ncbi:MAG TPA: hypothetical protein VNJ05_01090 [Sphingomicrobium sp.]|nr:hypothetical protein [Sphingomicrobium sp.]
MTIWFTFVLALMSITFAWQAYRGISRGSTNLPVDIFSIEEFKRGSIYFWGVIGVNVFAALALAVAAVLVYLNDWGSLATLTKEAK